MKKFFSFMMALVLAFSLSAPACATGSGSSTETGSITRLEGYLFPDTYEFYNASSEVTVIGKLLKRFDQVFQDSFMAKAESLGYTVVHSEMDDNKNDLKLTQVLDAGGSWKATAQELTALFGAMEYKESDAGFEGADLTFYIGQNAVNIPEEE